MSPSEASGERRPGRLHLKPTQADLEHAEWRQRKKERRKRKRAERAAKGYPESDEGSTKSSKSFKSSSTSRHHGHHRRREDGGRGRSNSPSTSSYGSRARHHPAPDARFGDNLFEAERAQAAEAEERIWAQKLADLASEDVGGAGEFGRVPGGMAGDELGWDDGEQEPYLGHVPKRWRDEGLAYAKKGAGLHDMDDEHYAEYMRGEFAVPCPVLWIPFA